MYTSVHNSVCSGARQHLDPRKLGEIFMVVQTVRTTVRLALVVQPKQMVPPGPPQSHLKSDLNSDLLVHLMIECRVGAAGKGSEGEREEIVGVLVRLFGLVGELSLTLHAE